MSEITNDIIIEVLDDSHKNPYDHKKWSMAVDVIQYSGLLHQHRDLLDISHKKTRRYLLSTAIDELKSG